MSSLPLPPLPARPALPARLGLMLARLTAGLSAALTPATRAPDTAARAPKTGHIALVGAGPGARDLLTLRALDRLRAAEVIFYDRLIDPEVLALAPARARLVDVGKAVGACHWPQARIDAAITAAALTGARVVRLKSGDPSIFGRATEELAAARRHGIPVEIVPGVTAASATGAALGRALTERGETDRLVIATGTCRPGDAAPDWGAMLAPGTTLALYMGVRQAGEIERSLRAAGVPPETEVEIAGAVSTAAERIARCTTGTLAATLAAEGIGNPAIILIRRPKGATTAAAATVAETAAP
ncbi:MAG: uroporphyrinogen-III C-methyltransferase [Paenirhodobacter sp.]|uniref:uroporphyrinogen-III C-methyltransferase n=1 Tax=Paenirhodobacter sp. TaxID=1965326 RepID=UPI003D0C4321